MIGTKRWDEVAAVDAFLASGKALRGARPEWTPSSRANELQAIWPIDAGAGRAQLRFRVYRAGRTSPSISVLFRSQVVWRLDLVPLEASKPNPPWAAGLGLPPEVVGPHCHEWGDNREYLLTAAPAWSLPSRRPLPAAVRRVPQALLWLAARIDLKLSTEQRGFDVPSKTDLSDL